MCLYLMQLILYLSAKEADLKGSAASPGVMKWVLENTQAKIKEFIEQLLRVVNMLFQAKDKNYHLYDDAVRMSFMLSVFIFIVVTIARIR
jgi:nitrate/nitrite-specific signal transduction histidine kinase